MSWDAISARSGEIDSVGPASFLTPLFGITTAVFTANEAKYVRFIPRVSRDIDAIRYRVQTLDAADPTVEVAIYDGVTRARLVTSGALAGKLNAGGVQDVPIPQFGLESGRVYYLGVVTPSATASLQATTISNAGFGVILGSSAPDLLVGVEAAAIPLPATATMTGSSATTLPIFLGVHAT